MSRNWRCQYSSSIGKCPPKIEIHSIPKVLWVRPVQSRNYGDRRMRCLTILVELMISDFAYAGWSDWYSAVSPAGLLSFPGQLCTPEPYEQWKAWMPLYLVLLWQCPAEFVCYPEWLVVTGICHPFKSRYPLPMSLLLSGCHLLKQSKDQVPARSGLSGRLVRSSWLIWPSWHPAMYVDTFAKADIVLLSCLFFFRPESYCQPSLWVCKQGYLFLYNNCQAENWPILCGQCQSMYHQCSRMESKVHK